jgi:glycosyltransferase involved in cell wall biosynthesis
VVKQITIFTATYNRAYRLSKLYDSLKAQTVPAFLWLIVDDGSTDRTSDLVKEWIAENVISIQYHKQANLGKSMAHNKGVQLTKTELFTCVDSDDFLCRTAVEDILACWGRKNNRRVVGILAFKGLPNGQRITSLKKQSIESTTLAKGYGQHGLSGDTMLIFRTKILAKYEFPYFKGEKFVPEAFLYDLVDQDGELLILPKVLYLCEYLDDGYSKNMAGLLAQNPKGYLAYIKQRLRIDTKIKDRVRDTIRYTAMCLLSREHSIITNSIYPVITVLTYPLGYLFYLKRYRGLK